MGGAEVREAATVFPAWRYGVAVGSVAVGARSRCHDGSNISGDFVDFSGTTLPALGDIPLRAS